MKKLLPVLPPILFSLLLAIWSGWSRIGWSLPLTEAAGQHGNLMVNSFLASLIFLERAVTFRQKWVLLLPLVNAVSGIAFATGHTLVAQWLQVAGSAGFLWMCGYFLWRHREWYYGVFGMGAACLLGGNLQLLRTGSFTSAVGPWMAFLLLTIVAERIELSKFLPVSGRARAVLLAALLLVVAALLLPPGTAATFVLAAGLFSTGAWLLRHDMARKALRAPGQHRYSAVVLLTGFAWLIGTAILLVFEKNILLGYDAVLHAFFIGFVLSMIFSHAPIILPAISHLPVKIFHPVMYAWFGLLQATLVLRICGDLLGAPGLRRWAGLGNGLVLLLFFATVAAI
ncbi:MAG: hypothetical protein EOO16_20365, partial [Chitinophagaceae bacterium]